MTDFNKFEHGNDSRELLTCEVCEAMCLDAVDGTLSAAEEAALERHVAGCVMCAEQLTEARRGAAWMEMLKAHRPEPPALLLAKILAQTTGTESAANAVDAAAVAAADRRNAAILAGQATSLVPEAPLGSPWAVAVPVAPGGWRKRLGAAFSFGGGGAYLQPRLAMTAAMAFFSIALTMSISGIRVTDLRPSSLHRTVADVSANAARSFQSLRVVNQVESRVSELRQDERRDDGRRDPGGPFADGASDAPKQAQPMSEQPAEKPAAKPEEKPNGSSELRMPGAPQLRQVAGGVGATEASAETRAVRKGA